MTENKGEDLVKRCFEVLQAAASFLRNRPGSPKFMLKIAKNAGDTIHGIPILAHYRKAYPDAAIAFVTCQAYRGIHLHNTDIDNGGLFSLPDGLSPQDRLKLWDFMNALGGITPIIPAINPFQAVHKSNRFSFPNIATQYFANARIPDRNPLAGREYRIGIVEADRTWAARFQEQKSLNPKKTILCEYHSYSHPIWPGAQWIELMKSMPDYNFVALAAKNEGVIPGMVDARGTPWKAVVAMAERYPVMIGVGSGNTMLAAGARPRPRIIEVGVPESVTMKTCGYAPESVRIQDPSPAKVRAAILEALK